MSSIIDANIVETFIDLVRGRPAIWNKAGTAHSDRITVLKCWQDIVEELSKMFGSEDLKRNKVDTVAKARRKWHNLRSNNRRTKRRNIKSGSGTEDVPTPGIWETQLSFVDEPLSQFSPPRDSFSQSSSSSENSTPATQAPGDAGKTSTEPSTSSRSQSVQPLESDHHSDGDSTLSRRNQRTPSTRASLAKLASAMEQRGPILHALSDSVKSDNNEEKVKDELDHFASFIVSSMRRLRSLPRRRAVMDKMYQCIQEALGEEDSE